MRTARASRWRRRPRSRPWGERHSGCPSWNDTTLGRFDTPPGLDALDLHQIHWPDPDAEIEEGWEALARLREEGKVRYIGVSNFSVAQLERARAIAPVTSLQPPYSAARPEAERDVLPFCRAAGIGVIVYSPMQAGLLSGAMTRERIAALAPDDWRRRNGAFQEPRLSRNLALQELLARIGARHGHSAGVAAIAWALRRPEVTGAIVGARRPEQVDGFIAAAELRLTADEVAEVEGFIREHP